MKLLILILSVILIPAFVFSQRLTGIVETEPEDMVLCPAGSYHKTGMKEGVSAKALITVEAFWMGHEITNKEFREFYNDVKQTPSDTIYWFDADKFSSDSESGKRQPVNSYVIAISHRDILPQLILSDSE